MKTVPILRRVSRIEGYSWLLLLCIAMPLKYWFGEPLAVRIVGSAHGFLFVAFCVALLAAQLTERWSVFRSVGYFVASFFPLGFLWIERGLHAHAEATEGEPSGAPVEPDRR